MSNLESFASTVNDLNPRLPKGRSRCFDIGQWGGCGLSCPVFLEGECEQPEDVIENASGENEAEINDAKSAYGIE